MFVNERETKISIRASNVKKIKTQTNNKAEIFPAKKLRLTPKTNSGKIKGTTLMPP